MKQSLSLNLLFNYVGSVWMALISIVFIPLYIKFLGVEAYGLVGFYATLNMVLFVLDLGLSATISREMARLSSIEGTAQTITNTVRTFEYIYWITGLIILSGIILIAPWIAEHWLTNTTISKEVVTNAVRLMGFLFFARWPLALYNGGLNGLEQQVTTNTVSMVAETLRSGGVVLLLWLYKADIITFFLWQAIVSIIATLISTYILWKKLPQASNPTFSKEILKDTWSFSAGMTAISIVSVILMQSDKLILSKMLSLEVFGYYSLASSVAGNLYRLVGPVYQAYYPKFVQAVAANNIADLNKKYHQSTQIIAVLIIPVAIGIMFFSYDILLLWTSNAVLANATAPILSILIIGSMCNGLMMMPYAAQLAYGWTKLALHINIISIIILIPLMYFLTLHYGVLGAASIWAILNISYVLIGVQFMYQKILTKEKRKWYIYSILFPICISFIFFGLSAKISNYSFTLFHTVILVILSGILAVCTTVLSGNEIKLIIFSKFKKITSI